MRLNEVVIVGAKRSAIGSFGGSLKSLSAVDLGEKVLKGVLDSIKLDSRLVEEVILGHVLQAGCGQSSARQVSLRSDIPKSSTAYSINKVCGSGLKAVELGYQSLALGDSEVVVAGGIESMSNAPFLSMDMRQGKRLGDSILLDSILKDGLVCGNCDTHMGVLIEEVCATYNISRDELDGFSASSHAKALRAIRANRFVDEIVPIKIQNKKEEIVFDADEFVKDTNKDVLAKLKPAFKKDGFITAGNSSGINDGAAMLVLMSASKAKKLGLKPMAKIKSFGKAGVHPKDYGLGPVEAIKTALKKASLTLKDIDLIEANEAFAAQTIAVDRELNFNHDILNVNGGAIALGHPIGASGARILVSLLYEMEKRDSKYGLAALCIGGGQGIACVVEREK
ncbi:acetyl-CoA C-acetyltransferase [Helicobacter sp. 11S02629-2]|uniref:acetyl-CoA C-acetyltransferase n=1 Tax=Helicobacter sp. 11S02629-2 TaxID=1476195 RepID=UPI000BA7B9D8|nr:acetyl-CoA C-acetyltransferase [Helicobacter sp. 11S02629-2]PAF45662.1 acetyl-CoA acetyltransferase [Helicobacter sp. 11S02629-2]